MPKQQALTIATGDAALIARRYALALYELAQENDKLAAIADDLRLLKLCLQENAELSILATQPRLSRGQVEQALAKLTAAKLDALTLNYLGLIAQKGRLSSLAAMIDAFMKRLETERGEYTADVTVARPLPEDLQAKLAKRLQELAGGKVHMLVREDDSLLGGLVIKVGSQLFDASIKSKLARLERVMKSEEIRIHKGAA